MDQNKIKSFLERPEGTTGLIVLTALGCISGGAIIYYLDTIIKLLQNMLYAGFLAGVVLLLTSLVLNDNFRWFVTSMFQSGMRALTGIWITIDPIGILKNYLEDMKAKLKKIEGYLEQLQGQITGLSHKVEEHKRSVEDFLKLAQAAQRLHQPDEMQLNANKAQREREWVLEMSETLQQMGQTSDILKHMKRNLNLLYDDTEHRVDLLTERYKAITSAHKAMRGAKELIEGDRKKEIFEQDCAYIAESIGMKLGEMDRFFEASHSTFANMDLKNDVFDKEGLALLTSWEKTGILSYESSRSIAPEGNPAKVRVPSYPSINLDTLEEEQEVPERPSSFSKIFETKR